MPSKRVSLKGKGADLFFGGSQEPAAPESGKTGAPPEPVGLGLEESTLEPADEDTFPLEVAADAEAIASHEPLREALVLTGDHDGYHASRQASTSDVTETIRKVVKRTGREVSFVRLSAEEKGRLADIVYIYKRQGIKTSENEINRIAINLLLKDYDTNGHESVLARVLSALQA